MLHRPEWVHGRAILDGPLAHGGDQAGALSTTSPPPRLHLHLHLIHLPPPSLLFQIFYGFRDRVESANLGHELGLVQFDSEVERLLAPTSDLAAFEEHIDRMAKRGATAIFSAVVEAAAMLAPAREAGGADAELRIVVLSDGQSNNGVPAERALEAAWALGATVDAIIVGPAADLNLRKICAATGGEVYQIHDLAEASSSSRPRLWSRSSHAAAAHRSRRARRSRRRSRRCLCRR